MDRDTTWAEDNYVTTLLALREDYPGYTDNELYAIWCRDNNLIPLDPLDGKVLIDQWQIHATHDGRHVLQDGFKVSRPLYGRALKAEKGVQKPTYKRRTRAEVQADREASGSMSSARAGFSEQAKSLAARFDEAKRRLDGVREAYRQLEMFRMRMQEIGDSVMMELASTDMEAREILENLSLLPGGDE